MYTDAMNLFELICYSKSLPNGNHHRVGVLALREDRLTRRLRNVLHIPTGIMLADPLTKHVQTRTFMRYAATGYWNTNLEDSKAFIRLRRAVHRPASYDEETLIKNDFTPSTGSIGEKLELCETFFQAINQVLD